MERLRSLLKVPQTLNSGAWIPTRSLASGIMPSTHHITLWVFVGGDEFPVMGGGGQGVRAHLPGMLQWGPLPWHRG